jgi:acyl-CoA thioesterase I
MLGTTPGNQFFKDLDALLGRIPTSSRCVMLELPLLPFHNGYGQAQRILARKHNIFLIPKSCITSVIGKTDNTLDGLHLSQKGHDALARSVFSLFRVTP